MKRIGLIALVSAMVFGCGDKPVATAPKNAEAPDEVAAERAKLAPEERALVDAQEWCPVTDEPLGSMGAPIKITVNGQAIYLCCASCEKKALANPDQTLAKVDELKAKKKTQAK